MELVRSKTELIDNTDVPWHHRIRKPPSSSTLDPSLLFVSHFLWGAFLIVFLSFPSRLASQSIAEPDTAFVDALWLAQSRHLSKIAVTDGSAILETASRARHLLVDAERDKIWIFGGGTLSRLDHLGELHGIARLTDGDDRLSSLALNAADGGVWLGIGKQMFGLDANGSVRISRKLRRQVLAIAFDSRTSLIWVATPRSVSAFDNDAQPIRSLNLAHHSRVRTLTVDTRNGDVWVATEEARRGHGADDATRRDHRSDDRSDDESNDSDNVPRAASLLHRFTADGVLLFSLRVPGIRHLAADGRGGLWVASRSNLHRIDAESGLVLFSMQPFHSRKIDAIAPHPRDGSVWLAGGRRILHVGA